MVVEKGFPKKEVEVVGEVEEGLVDLMMEAEGVEEEAILLNSVGEADYLGQSSILLLLDFSYSVQAFSWHWQSLRHSL